TFAELNNLLLIFGDQLALNDCDLIEFQKEIALEMDRYIQLCPPITTNMILNNLVKFLMYSRGFLTRLLIEVKTVRHCMVLEHLAFSRREITYLSGVDTISANNA
uniref:Uncharacterized protein n=1 Tax=Glossina pallidipes TaxID=7398 RepID=A0A1A9Z0C7_GLOPL